ncbi:MAG: hypothetical protein H0U29_05880 [Acidimicrobiia bacterium]|nr:hypothetical protein [Acidimicrobiia bacterium]
MTEQGADGPGSAGARSRVLAAALATLDHPAARRRFVAENHSGGGGRDDGGRPDRVTWAQFIDPVAVARRRAADQIDGLGIAELTGAMAFHAVAVPVVDLVVSLLVVYGCAIDLDPYDLVLGMDGDRVVEVVVPEAAVRAVFSDPAGPTAVAAGGIGTGWLVDASADDLADRVAALLIAALDPVVALVEPVDAAHRWGAVADLVAVLAAGRQRAQHLPVEPTWAAIYRVVASLRDRRPHPAERPGRLAVPAPAGGGQVLALARRSTCCQWYRASRPLGEPSAANARCADCPSLDPDTNVSRLAALARTGDLGRP